jgi:RNA polymerase sigma-70 factor (ECF subfamily)
MSPGESDIGLWAGVMIEHRALAVNVCRGMLGDMDAAEDAVQMVIAGILGKLDQGALSFSSREHARNYLLKSIRNKAQDILKSGARKSPDSEEILPHVQEPGEDPLAALISREEEEGRKRRLDELAHGLSALKTGEREVLTFRFVEGMKYREISELTGIPITTLKSREDSALKKLRAALEKSGPGS